MARPGAFAFAPTENPQLRRPVRESQAQAMEVGVARADFDFDLSQLPAAALDSCRHPETLRGDVRKRSAVGFERSRLPAELLEPSANDIAVLRFQLHHARLAAGLLARDQRCARPAEDIKDRIAGLAAVPDGALDQLDRLHRRMLQIR